MIVHHTVYESDRWPGKTFHEFEGANKYEVLMDIHDKFDSLFPILPGKWRDAMVQWIVDEFKTIKTIIDGHKTAAEIAVDYEDEVTDDRTLQEIFDNMEFPKVIFPEFKDDDCTENG